MRGTWPRPSSAISRSSHPSTFPSIDPSSTPSFTSSRPLPPTRSTRSSPSSTFRPAISSKPQPEKPLSGFLKNLHIDIPFRSPARVGRRRADEVDFVAPEHLCRRSVAFLVLFAAAARAWVVAADLGCGTWTHPHDAIHIVPAAVLSGEAAGFVMDMGLALHVEAGDEFHEAFILAF